MYNILNFILKFYWKVFLYFHRSISRRITIVLLRTYGVSFQKGLKSNGIPRLFLGRGSKIVIGGNFKMNNGKYYNAIGRQQKCIFNIKGKLLIGDNVGMSSTTIVCRNEIIIGSNVLIGGNTVVYDTDFHSLNPKDWADSSADKIKAKSLKVKIGNNVFIGGHSTILKDVEIGDNSIVGACSVVASSIPPNEIWAGNPAKFIKKIE